jgi:protein involved in polysaccharide export with SLBB domain
MVDGKEVTLNVDAKDIGRNKANASFPVYAGDTLIVEVVDNEFIVLGQVNHPGSYSIPAFHDSVDLIEAIAMAGGATRLADTGCVTIRRMSNGKPTVIRADAKKLARSASNENVDVLPGDRIVVSERIF